MIFTDKPTPDWLEVQQLRAELARVTAERDALSKAWVLRELEECRAQDTNPEDCGLENLPPGVAALIREHADKPIGHCDFCGQRGPMNTYGPDNETGHCGPACAWGCAKGGESDDQT